MLLSPGRSTRRVVFHFLVADMPANHARLRDTHVRHASLLTLSTPHKSLVRTAHPRFCQHSCLCQILRSYGPDHGTGMTME